MKLFLFNNDEKLIGTVSPLEGIQNEEINKIQTIECTVVYSELIEKASYIGHKDYSDNRIFHLYKIDHITKTSTTDVKIVGVHTFFDDMESDGYVKDFRPTNRELVGVLTTILDGSRWQLGTVNIQRRFTGNFYYVTRKEALSKLIEATQIEIKPRLEFSRGKITGRYLDVFTRLGARNGKVFVHGRDLLTVSEKKSQGAIYTAVVGRGKGEETDTGGYGRRISFKDVEWRRTSGQPVDKPVGQEYVEIPAMTKLYGFEKGTKPRIKIVEFQDETDKEKLLRLSYEWLEKNSRMQVEYSAKVLNVGNLELGDTVGIFNPKLGIKYETRVFKVKRNLVDNKLTEFGIGDKVTTSPFSRTIELAKEMKNFQDDTVYWLDKIRERLSDKLINEDGYNYDLKADNEYKVPAGYYSFDKPIDQNPTKVVYMGAGKIAIADSKKPTGEWNWRTFLDGRGATLDLINTGVLRAGRIQSADGRSYWDLDTGEFHMEQSAINEAVKTVVNGKVQEIVGEVKKNLPTKEELKGKSSYLHKKYSDFADGRNMSDNSTLKYIGIYTGDKQQAPTNASEYSWTKIKVDGKLYKAYSNSLNGLDFTLVEPDENAKLFAKNRPRVNIVNDNDISDIWQANMFLSFKPNTKYTLTARAKGNSNKLWAYFRNNKTSEEYSWGQLEFRGLETKSITFTTTNDVEDVLFKFVLVPEDEDWTGIQIDWFTIYEGDNRYTDYPVNEPAQYHKYRYFGYVFKESTPVASDFEWFDLQQTSITNDKYTHIVYSDNADGSNFGREPKKYMGVARTTSPTQPADKTAYKWFKVTGEDGRDGVDGKSINRNYITGSDKLTNINSGGTNWEKTVENGTLVFTKVRATEGTGIWTQIMPILKDNFQNEVLTWSVDVKASKNISFNNVGQETNGFKGRVDITTQWQRISHTFTNRYTQHYAFVFYQMIGTCSPGDKVYVRLPKLEKGNVATEWSPAYEDLRGRDGVSNYIHRKYSDSSNGANMDDNSNRKYIGIYTGTIPTPPTTASSYLWSKIKGEDGANGVPGAKGADGRTPYFHTAYSNSPTGDRDFSTINSNDKLYIGTYSDFEVADSNDYRRYKWVKIKGEDGRNGVSSYIYRKYSDNANGSPMSDNSNLKYIGIYTGTSATAPTTPTAYTWSKIKGEDGQQGVPGARGADGKTSYLHTAYANSATGDRDFSTTNSNGKEYIGTYTDFEINDSNDYRRYKWVKIKGENGRDGNNGRDGRDGNVELNLLNGTKEFVKSQFASPDNFQKNLVWIDEIERYEDFAVKSTIYQFNGLWQNVKVEKGKTYEFGFFAKGSRDTDRILFSPGWASSSAKQPLAQYNINSIPFKLTTAWKFYSFRFTVTQTGWSQCRVEKNEVNNGIKFSLCGLYLKELKNDQSSPLGWSPSIEDLQGHSLTANLWFSGNYINNVTSNVRLNLVVYYDGKEIRDFNANIKYVGGGINDWRTQENVRVLRDNTVDYGFWSNSEKNGTPLFALAIVSYKGLQIISDARLDNVPNVEDIKETIKKFKTFESTLDSFKSVIGEIKSKEIKTIINTPNLCTEDFSNNKSKRGNDLYFNVSPSLKANTKYTVIVDVSLEKVEVHQKTKVYGAKSGGGEQWLKSGRNVWIVDYATEQTRVNIYPLGEFSKVFNVEIYEGDYREFIEQNNRFVSMDTAKREQSGFYSYKINHNINNGKGKYFLVKFDLASLPADKWFASGDNGTLALYSFGAKQFTEELKLKDNEYIFKAHLDDTFYIFHSTNSLNLINVRLYEVRFGVTLATQNSLIDISSMIDQSKEAVTLSARKEIEGKLTNYPTNAYLLNNFANKQELENLVSKSELKVLSDRIESSVNTGNFGTTLSQNAYYVRVAWNSISNYVQFENGGLNFYEGSTTQNNLRARIDDGNYTFWRDGYNLGNMGTGYYAKDNNKKGIQFHLEYDGWFMGWAYKQKRTDNFYTWKWYYTSGSVGDTYADTLNAGCNTNFRWNEIWYFKTRTSWFNIMDGLNGTISVVSNIENTGDGGIRWWTRNLTFKNGILIGG